jgi:hypothetical protein
MDFALLMRVVKVVDGGRESEVHLEFGNGDPVYKAVLNMPSTFSLKVGDERWITMGIKIPKESR